MKRLVPVLAGLLLLGGLGLAWRAESAPTTRMTTARLGAMVRALWPLRLENLADRGTGVSSWAEADRRYVWARLLCAAADRTLAGHPDRLRKDAQADIGKASEPAGETTPGDALTGVLRQADKGSEDPSADSGSELAPGELGWPVREGRVIAGFEADRSGRRGLALATVPGAPVRAAARGRVVFTGKLRRLDRVVILRHGPHWHTVYACLSRVAVGCGQEVDRETPLGAAGVCPQARGAGVYFELRFGEKALNPAEWLATGPKRPVAARQEGGDRR